MSPLRRPGQFLALALSALAFTGCAASMRINSFAERGIDLTRYQTYSWSAADAQATGDARLDNNPFVHDRIRMEVEKHLTARGLAKVIPEAAELVIQARVHISQRIDPDSANWASGYDAGQREAHSDPPPFLYDAGTIMLDFVDAWTGKLVWRGWAETSMDQVIENQAWMEEKIDQSVMRILSTFPRGVDALKRRPESALPPA